MDSSKVLMLGALGVGGYLAWRWYNNQAMAAAAPAVAGATLAPVVLGTSATQPSGVSATVPPATGGSTPAGPPPASATATSLDSVYSALAARATAGGIDISTGKTADGSPVGPDGWNYYLALVYAVSLPAPETTFPGIDRAAAMPLAAYWGVMAQWLKDAHGLAGLGIFGGLGAIAARYR